MLKAAIYFLILFAAFFIFTTCKKYPKNTLILKRPIKVVAGGGNNPWVLEYYSVNDIDSSNSDFLIAYKEKGLVISSEDGHEKYSCIDILSGFWEFFDKKKIIAFKFADFNSLTYSPSNPTYVNQRNIFL